MMMTRDLVLNSLIVFALNGGKSCIAADANTHSPDAIVRLHWLGRTKISADTNAASFMQIWNLLESGNLERQTLDKLSATPWRFLRNKTDPASTNLLRPLLEDLLDNEFYLEIDQPSTNSPGELVLAIQLNDPHAALGRTNVAAALESLTGIRPTPAGNRWSLKKHHVPNFIQFARVGEWVVLGAAQDQNRLFDKTVTEIERNRTPFAVSPTNSWLEARLDLRRIGAAIGHQTKLPANFPQISITMLGDAKKTLTRCQLNFPEDIPGHLESWNIPTNLINGYLYSFTAVRGCQARFVSQFWNQFETNPPPDQFYLWSCWGAPMETYFAAPVSDASNVVSRLGDFVLQGGGGWFATNDSARFQRAKKFNGLEWKGIPFISPFLRSVDTPGGQFVLGGFSPLMVWEPVPLGLVRELEGRTNLVYYSWELTGPGTEQLTYLSQCVREIMNKPGFSSQSLALSWLKAISRKLGESRTEIVRTGSRQFELQRSADLPFTAFELQILVDWLESPQFPAFGLFEFNQ